MVSKKCVAVENDLFSVSGSKLTRFLCRGIETDLTLGIEMDLTSVMGSKSTCFLCAGSKLTCF